MKTPKLLWLVTVAITIAGAAVLALNLPVHWKQPSLLWMLALPFVVALGIAMRWWLRERATERFGVPSTLEVLVAGNGVPWRVARATVLVLGLTFVVLALAGPQYGSRTRVLHKQGIDVVIALDFSKSMLARDVRPSRIDRAKAELLQLLDELDGDRVGVVAFAGDTMEFPMTNDYAAVGLFLSDLGPYDMPVGGTAIGRALVSSKRLLERSTPSRPEGSEGDTERSRVVILLTDGEDHEGDPVDAARELASAGVQVMVVGIGSRSGEPIPTYSPDGTWTGYLRDREGNVVHTALTSEAEETLEEIAEVTDGAYFRAQRGQVGVDRIRARMRAMHQSEQESRRVVTREDRYALALLPGFLLLLLEPLLPEAWIGRRRRKKPMPRRRTRRKK